MDPGTGLTLRTRLELLRHSLPGLVHFGRLPLTVPVGRRVRRVRLRLRGVDAINLRGVVLDGASPADLAAAEFTMPPALPGFAAAAALTEGREVLTERAANPCWQVTFRDPVEIRAVAVTNQLGTGSVRNAGLLVEDEDEDWIERCFDNADPALLLERAEGFAAAAGAMCDGWGAEDGTGFLLSHVRAASDRLCRELSAALAGAPGPLNRMEAVRLGLVEDIVELVEARPVESLAEGMRLAVPVLEYLLYRGKDEESPAGDEAETRAVALLYAEEFLRRRSVPHARLRDNQRFTGTPERVRIVDAYVSSTYERVTGDTSLSPIMIRSHGLSGGTLRREAPAYLTAIREVETLLAGLGYEIALCYGTFLGAYRDGAFIAHDDDVDVATPLRAASLPEAMEEMKALVAALAERGVRASLHPAGFIKLRAPAAGKSMDVFPIVATGGEHVQMLMQAMRFRDVPRDAVLPFGNIEFYGESFRCPRAPEAFLQERYGPTWVIPMREVGGRVMEADAPQDRPAPRALPGSEAAPAPVPPPAEEPPPRERIMPSDRPGAWPATPPRATRTRSTGRRLGDLLAFLIGRRGRR